MKKLPIGIQSIRKVLTEGHTYVDKTQSALDLIENGKHYFLSRPRRFGKSLFLSTLEEIFKGNKELFQGCHIYGSNYDWQPYPVLQLNFSITDNRTKEALEASVQNRLGEIAKKHSLQISIPSTQAGLRNLIEALSKKGPVVVLIDEHDKPLTANLDQLEVLEDIRRFLQSFYSTLKSLDQYIKFTFVTGTTNFPYVSLFSGGNHLQDISGHARYACIMGYTYEEITDAFAAHIKAVVQAQSRTESAVLAEIKAWYGGYRFSSTDTEVCNPCSVLKYLDRKESQIYWQATTLSSHVHHEIVQNPASIVPLRGAKATDNNFMNPDTLVKRDLKLLMFYAGYLTIKGYDARFRYYDLGFPNREVRKVFTSSLIRDLANLDSSLAYEMEGLLIAQDWGTFIAKINAILSVFPHHMFSEADESTYHSFLLSMFSEMGISVAAETPANLGRLDFLVQMSSTTYIMRLSLDKVPNQGIEQLKEKQYHLPYLHQSKKLALVCINFSSASHHIASWSGELLDERGDLIQILNP